MPCERAKLFCVAESIQAYFVALHETKEYKCQCTQIIILS